MICNFKRHTVLNLPVFGTTLSSLVALDSSSSNMGECVQDDDIGNDWDNLMLLPLVLWVAVCVLVGVTFAAWAVTVHVFKHGRPSLLGQEPHKFALEATFLTAGALVLDVLLVMAPTSGCGRDRRKEPFFVAGMASLCVWVPAYLSVVVATIVYRRSQAVQVAADPDAPAAENTQP